MIEPYKVYKTGTLYNADCLEVMREMDNKSVDLVLTDPPYPDYYCEKYKYNEKSIKYLDKFKCKQFIFWTAKEDFIMNYTAIHIWDKKVGVASCYERIFERNGGSGYRVYNYYFINSTVAASYNRDYFTGHKSQKPIGLIRALVKDYSNFNNIILDPYIGSGTTAVACIETDRRFIGIEISKEYCDIADKRIKLAYDKKRQVEMFK